MTLASHYVPGRLGLSFELFPPKTEAGGKALFRHVDQLVDFRPDFITCTYGAGGSTRDKTLEIVRQVKQQYSLPVASHLTCVGSTVEQLRAYLSQANEGGIDYIVALRGDPPSGETNFEPVPGGLRYANELVELIRAEFGSFGIAVAGYPETHQEAASPKIDLENLKRKVDCGADIVITQLFYNNDDFFQFRRRCVAAGIQTALIPGILPVTNLSQIQRITSMCRAGLPQSFIEELGQRDDDEWQFQVGVEFATRQVQELIKADVPGIHFYVLNKSQATSAVLQAIRRPE
jgi:methylenetetrahydrofolate reductase (NADPH)